VAYGYDANLNPSLMIDYLNGTPTVKASFVLNPNARCRPRIATILRLRRQPGAVRDAVRLRRNGNMTGKTDPLGPTPCTPMTRRAGSASRRIPRGHHDVPVRRPRQPDRTTAQLGRATSSLYDANGNKTSDTDANGLTTTYQYDALNRLWVTTYPTPPPNNTSTLTYDFRNNVVNATDQAGNVTHNDYDLAGRLIAVTRAYGATDASKTTYTYYDDGRRHTQTDPPATRQRTLTTRPAACHGRGCSQQPDPVRLRRRGNQISITDAKGTRLSSSTIAASA